MQHRTTGHDATGADDGAPWLVSMVMWCNCMRFLRPEGMTVRELEQLARTRTNLAGMQRWGYLVVEPVGPPDGSPILAADLVIRPTPGGRRAQFVWGPLPRLIEDRWRQRFGEETVERLRRALWGVVGKLETPLPNCMPILHQGWTTTVTCTRGPAPRHGSDLRLSALLARALLAFAVPFERRADLSLAISANAVRVLSPEFVRVRDVPRMAGVATEATRIALGLARQARLRRVQDRCRGRSRSPRAPHRQGRQSAEHVSPAGVRDRVALARAVRRRGRSMSCARRSSCSRFRRGDGQPAAVLRASSPTPTDGGPRAQAAAPPPLPGGPAPRRVSRRSLRPDEPD